MFHTHSTLLPPLALSAPFSSKVAIIIGFGFKIQKHSDKYCSELGSQLTMLLNETFCDFEFIVLIVVCTLLKCLISMRSLNCITAFSFNKTGKHTAGLSGHEFIQVTLIDSHQMKCWDEALLIFFNLPSFWRMKQWNNVKSFYGKGVVCVYWIIPL